MKILKGRVASVVDLNKSGSFRVDGLGADLGETHVTYVSPTMSLNSGLFAPPSVNSEVLVLHIEAEDNHGKDAGYYYLGTAVGHGFGESQLLDLSSMDEDLYSNPTAAKNIKRPGAIPKLKSLGLDSDTEPKLPLSVVDGIYANQVTPEIMGMFDKGQGGIAFFDQKVGGEGKDAWMSIKSRFQSGAGKRIDLNDTPAEDCILITTGKSSDSGGQDIVMLAGKQTGPGAESNDIQAGEFRVDSHGPTNIVSRRNGVELRVKGLNLDIINAANGEMSGFKDGRKMVDTGGGDAKGDVADRAPEERKGDLFNFSNQSIPYPQASQYAIGQAHTDPNKPGSGGDPTDHGVEDWGCVNIRSDWNNLNLEAFGEDSVIRINAPGGSSKIVVTTGGTVDIVAVGKISLTSNEKIELNAPNVDINSGNRVDID